MIGALARRFFGSANDRYIKGLGAIVRDVNALEPELLKLSDDELRARTPMPPSAASASAISTSRSWAAPSCTAAWWRR